MLAWGPLRVYSPSQTWTTQSSPSDGLGNWLWDCSWEQHFDLHLWNSFCSGLDLWGMDAKCQKNKMQLFLVHHFWQINFWPLSGFVKIWKSLPQFQVVRKEYFFCFPLGCNGCEVWNSLDVCSKINAENLLCSYFSTGLWRKLRVGGMKSVSFWLLVLDRRD